LRTTEIQKYWQAQEKEKKIILIVALETFVLEKAESYEKSVLTYR
jgi:hypothetical protein